MAAIHETMEALHRVGAVDKRTMHRFDAASLVSKWERGEKRPSGASLKLLSLVREKGWPPSPEKARSTAWPAASFDLWGGM